MANAALILAAGASKRMGRPKQLLPWGEHNLLQKVIKEVNGANFDAVIVVVGANFEKIVPTLPNVTHIAINEDWEQGMGSSISCGIKSMRQLPFEFESVMIVLADQPLMDAIYFKKLLESFKKKQAKIIATDYNGRAGVPALFDAHYFNQLAALEYAYGAKELLVDNKEACLLVNAGSKTRDVDTNDDYNFLNNKFN